MGEFLNKAINLLLDLTIINFINHLVHPYQKQDQK